MPSTRASSVFALLVALSACGENAGSDGAATGGSAGSPASSTGGGPGGSGATSSQTGGAKATGGSSTGGTVSSGGATGGAGAETNTGGKAGGAGGPSGGTGTGGTANGGTANGGMAAGGRPGTGAAGAGGSNGGAGAGGGTGGSNGGSTAKCGPVTAVPEEVRKRLELDPFYKKHVDANGISVLASDEPDDQSLILACELLNNMLGERDDVRQELIRREARFAIIGKDEGTAEIPEYGYRTRPQEDIDYINERARGLGGIVASCGEENILCLDGDRYYNESICVHEFAHTISMYGAYSAIDDFESDLEAAFDSAMDSGILEDTYRTSNAQEYWGEGVQDWYNTNASSNPPNGVHNSVNTREELADYDPTLYALIDSLFPAATEWGDCHEVE